MRVKVQDQHRPGPGGQRGLRRDDQPVEGAEPGPSLVTGVVEAAGQRPGHALFQRRTCRCDDTPVRRQHHRPQPGIPSESLRLGQFPRHAGLDRADIARIVDGGHLIPGQRLRLGQLDPRKRRFQE